MRMSILALARPEIRDMQPYSSARMEASSAAIMLNANESPWPGAAGLNRYPDPQPEVLRERMAALYGVAASQLLIGRGSDEAIDLLVRAFCRAGLDSIVICPPTFGMYAVAAAVQGARVVEVPLAADFALETKALLAAVNEFTRLVFVCTPNNPTGNLIALDHIGKLARALDARSLIVVDEAYIEYAEAPSATGLLATCDNVVVLRTLSKAHALAGARVGALLAHADIVALLRRILPAYPLPAPSIAAALAAVQADALAATRQRIERTIVLREDLISRLRAIPDVVEVMPSVANFVTIRCEDASAAQRRLLAAGVVVRDVGRYPRLRNCLRISIGDADECASVVRALQSRRNTT
jgi:histidinol-phosphate aminotransferase